MPCACIICWISYTLVVKYYLLGWFPFLVLPVISRWKPAWGQTIKSFVFEKFTSVFFWSFWSKPFSLWTDFHLLLLRKLPRELFNSLLATIRLLDFAQTSLLPKWILSFYTFAHSGTLLHAATTKLFENLKQELQVLHGIFNSLCFNIARTRRRHVFTIIYMGNICFLTFTGKVLKHVKLNRESFQIISLLFYPIHSGWSTRLLCFQDLRCKSFLNSLLFETKTRNSHHYHRTRIASFPPRETLVKEAMDF